MRYLPLILLSLIILVSCQDDDDLTGVFIRVENRSDVEIRDLEIYPGGGDGPLYFGTVSPGRITDYQFVAYADNCGFSESMTTSEGDTIEYPGFICIAPSPIDPGKYRAIYDSLVNGDEGRYFAIRGFIRE